MTKGIYSYKSFNELKSVDRKRLKILTAQRVKNIHSEQVANVVDLLLDEMIIYLQTFKPIHVVNFGQFTLKKMAPFKHLNIFTGNIELTNGRSFFSFRLTKKIQKMLIKDIDLEKTFNESKNEKKGT